MGSSRPKGAVLSGDLAVTTRPKDAASSTGTTAPVPYWYNPQIHTFGNVGLGGFFHALMAPLATAVIDRASYGGLDVRKVAHDMIGTDKTVLDLCCGVGFSTMEGGHAIDTSPMMLNVARFHRPDLSFSFGNAETYGDTQGYDVVTIMYAMHEMPGDARKRVLANMMRVARESVVIVDIHPEFQETLAKKPMNGEFFLMGEPNVLEYLTNIDTDVFSAAATHPRFSIASAAPARLSSAAPLPHFAPSPPTAAARARPAAGRSRPPPYSRPAQPPSSRSTTSRSRPRRATARRH
jgi:SAM-dependent methyltransferase